MEEKKKFVEDLLGIASSRMTSAVSAYYIWKHLALKMNTNTAGAEIAERNVKVFNDHKYFFHPLFQTNYKSFVGDLSIFFDKNYQDSFSIEKLLLSLDNLVPKKEVENLRLEIEKIKYKRGVDIKHILELRNADVAHQEIKVQKRFVKYEDTEVLFSTVQDILNLISTVVIQSSTSWNHLEGWTENDIEHLIRNLERGEIVRLKEIEEEYREELESSK